MTKKSIIENFIGGGMAPLAPPSRFPCPCYYKPVRVSSFWSNNYIEYESNGDRNKTLSAKEYLNKIRPYLKLIRRKFN